MGQFAVAGCGVECRPWIRVAGDCGKLCLRVYINGIDKWWPMLPELNVTIDNTFKEAGVTIAFPQRDVHLDATGPLEVQVVSEPAQPLKTDGTAKGP